MFRTIIILILLFSHLTDINGLFFNTGSIKFPSYLKRNTNIRSLEYLIKKGSNTPILIDGDGNFVEEVLRKFASDCRKKVHDVTYDKFIETVPHLCGSGNIIYVHDFLPKQIGRIFNEYETNFMQGLRCDKNLVVLETNELQKIPFKDDEMLKSYHYLKFPTIHRKHLVLHVKNMIEQNGYDEYLANLPWDSVPLEQLNFELLNILIYDLAYLRSECSSAHISFDSISFTINDMKAFHNNMKRFKY